MKFHIIFENSEISNELESTISQSGHEVAHVSMDFKEALEKMKSNLHDVDVVLASDMAITGDLEGDKYQAILEYLKQIRDHAANAQINMLCKKKVPGYFQDGCSKLGVTIEFANAEVELSLDKKDGVQQDAASISTDLPEEPVNNFEEIAPELPEEKLKLLVALPEEDVNLERRIKGLSGVSVLDVLRTRKGLREKANLMGPDVIIAAADLPSELDGNWLDICSQVQMEIEIYIVKKSNAPLNEAIEGKLINNGVEFISENPSIGELKEKILYQEDREEAPGNAGDTKKVEVRPSSGSGRGKRIDPEKINKIVGSVSSVTQNAITAMAGASKGATKVVKSMKLSFKTSQERLENLVVVVSPSPAGKSFVAQNLATMLAKFNANTTLVDLSHSQSQYVNFKIPFQGWEEEYKTVIERGGRFEDFGFETNLGGRLSGDLRIFSTDPALNLRFNADSVCKLLKYASNTSDYVVVDMPQNLTAGYTDIAMSMANTMVMVMDTDLAHVASLANKKQEFDDYVVSNRLLLLNKYFKIGDIPENDILTKTLTGRRKELPVADGVLTVPFKHEAVAVGQCLGKPSIFLSPDILKSFQAVYQYIKKVIAD